MWNSSTVRTRSSILRRTLHIERGIAKKAVPRFFLRVTAYKFITHECRVVILCYL